MRFNNFIVGSLGLAGLVASAGSAGAQGPPTPPDVPVTRLVGPQQPIQLPTPGSTTAVPGSPGPSPISSPGGQRVGRPTAVPVTQLDDRKPATDLDAPRSVSLSVSRPVSVRSLLLLLVRGTGFSLVPEEHVSGTFSGTLKGLTMRQALEAVLFPRSLDYDVKGTVIRVFPRKPMTRFFDLNYVNVRRAVARAGVSGVSNAEADTDFFREVSDGVAALLSASGRAHVDRVAGLVQATDFTDRLERIAVYLETIQLRAGRQVRIDARIFAFQANDATRSSVDWRAIASRPGGGIRMMPGQAAAGLQVDDFAALMKALAEQGSVRMIAAPQLLALNNQPALLHVGAEVTRDDVVAEVRADAAHVAAVLEDLTLAVTAQVGADGVVQIHLAPAYAERARHLASAGRDVTVTFGSEAETLVRVRDGETVVLSGLLQERARDARPGRAAERSDLVVLLTPTIVGPAALAGIGQR